MKAPSLVEKQRRGFFTFHIQGNVYHKKYIMELHILFMTALCIFLLGIFIQ